MTDRRRARRALGRAAPVASRLVAAVAGPARALPADGLAGGDAARAVVDRAAHLAGGLVAVARVERERDRDRVGQLGADGGDERVERRAAPPAAA